MSYRNTRFLCDLNLSFRNEMYYVLLIPDNVYAKLYDDQLYN